MCQPTRNRLRSRISILRSSLEFGNIAKIVSLHSPTVVRRGGPSRCAEPRLFYSNPPCKIVSALHPAFDQNHHQSAFHNGNRNKTHPHSPSHCSSDLRGCSG